MRVYVHAQRDPEQYAVKPNHSVVCTVRQMHTRSLDQQVLLVELEIGIDEPILFDEKQSRF
jgi:hypothetical protein